MVLLTKQEDATPTAPETRDRSVGAADIVRPAELHEVERSPRMPRQQLDPVESYLPSRPSLSLTFAEGLAFVRPRSACRTCRTLPRLDRRPVLVLPVIGRADAHTALMRSWLDELGCRTFGWGLGTNYGPTSKILDGIEHRLLSLHAQHGPVTVIGFSLGGVFARRLGHLHSDKIDQVITVCSPFRETVNSAFVPLRPLLKLWRTRDLLELAAQAARPLPVHGTFLFSRNDGIVAWRSCIEPDQPQDCFEISGPHVTITRDADVLAILARRLARTLVNAPGASRGGDLTGSST